MREQIADAIEQVPIIGMTSSCKTSTNNTDILPILVYKAKTKLLSVLKLLPLPVTILLKL